MLPSCDVKRVFYILSCPVCPESCHTNNVPFGLFKDLLLLRASLKNFFFQVT